MSQAEKELADAEIDLASILNQERMLPGKIKSIEDALDEYMKNLSRNQAEISRIQALINGMGVEDLVTQIENLEKSILALRMRVMEADGELSSSLEPLEDLKSKLEGAERDLAYLKTQVGYVEEELRQAYIQGNDFNTLVAHAKENLETVNTRYRE